MCKRGVGVQGWESRFAKDCAAARRETGEDVYNGKGRLWFDMTVGVVLVVDVQYAYVYGSG